MGRELTRMKRIDANFCSSVIVDVPLAEGDLTEGGTFGVGYL